MYASLDLGERHNRAAHDASLDLGERHNRAAERQLEFPT